MRAALARPGVRSVVAVTALVVLGHYTFFSYISIYLREAGVPGAGTSAALLVYGVAGVAGTVVLGRAYDRWPGPSFASLTTALLLALATLAVLPLLGAVGPGGLAPWIAPATVGAVAVLGAAAIALPVPLQAMILQHAGPAPDAASSLFVSAFNLGIGGGGAVGALVLSTTDAPFLPVVALVVAAAGVATAARTAPTRAHAQQEVNA